MRRAARRGVRRAAKRGDGVRRGAASGRVARTVPLAQEVKQFVTWKGMWSPSVISKTRRRPFFCRLTDATILRRALFVSLPSCRQGGATRWVACVYGGQTWQARTQHPRRGERGAVHLVHVELGRGRNGVERCPWERAHRHGRVVGVVGGGVQVGDGLRRHEATRGHHEEGITSRGTGPARHIAARGGPRAARHGARRGAARGAGSGTTHLLDQVEPLVAHLGGALERARRVEGRRLVPLQQGLALDKEADVPAACARASWCRHTAQFGPCLSLLATILPHVN